MVVLDERVEKILKYRFASFDEPSIAAKLRITTSELQALDESAKSALEGAVSEGVLKLREISRRLRLPERLVLVAHYLYGVEIPFTLTPEQAENYLRKLKVENVAFLLKVTPATARSNLIKLGLIPKRKPRQDYITDLVDETQQKRQLLQEWANIMQARIGYLLQRESWHVQKAFEYLSSLKRIGPQSYRRFDSLVKLFQRYEDAKRQGLYISLKKLGDGLGLSQSEIGKIIQKVGLSYLKNLRIEFINQALAEGVNSLEELCRRSGLRPIGFYSFRKVHDIQLPDNIAPYRYRPEMDSVIDRRGTLKEIGIAGGYPEKSAKENARLYVLDSGQYKLLREL